MIFGGLIIGITGGLILYEFPSIPKDAIFPGEFSFDDGQKGDLQINFHADSGLMPTSTVTANISVNFHETKTNSSKVEMDFPNARVLNPNDAPQIAKEGKIVTLIFVQNNSKTSTYIAKPSLTYYSANQYDTILQVKSGNHTVNKEFGTMITIGSWDSFSAQHQGNEIQGLTFMIIGIGLIGSAPTFVKLVDVHLRRERLKNDAFYE